MSKRGNKSKRLLAMMLSVAMTVLNISTAVPAYAAPSAEEYREDAELINDLALPKSLQQQLRTKGASPSDATGQNKTAEDILAGTARWGTPSNAAVCYTLSSTALRLKSVHRPASCRKARRSARGS